jgi:hypothetical protein
MCADKATACAARRCEKTFVSCRLVLPSTNANTAGARRCGGVFALPCAFCCRCVVNHTCRRSCARNGPPTAPPNHAQLPSQAKGKPYMRNRLCKPEISPGVCHGERRQAAVLCTCFSLQLCNFGSWQGEIVPAGVCAPRKNHRLRRLTMRNHLHKPEVSPGVRHGERRQAAVLCACFSPIFSNFGSWQGEIVPAGVCAPGKGPPTAPLDHEQPPLQARGKPWCVPWRAQASRVMRRCSLRVFHCSCAILAVGRAKSSVRAVVRPERTADCTA